MKRVTRVFDFSLEEWLKDKSVRLETMQGEEAKILCYDRKCKKPGEPEPFPIVAIAKVHELYNENQELMELTADGEEYTPQHGYRRRICIVKEYKPKFVPGDILTRKGWSNMDVKSYDDNYGTYLCENEDGQESDIPIEEQDEWTLSSRKRVDLVKTTTQEKAAKPTNFNELEEAVDEVFGECYGFRYDEHRNEVVRSYALKFLHIAEKMLAEAKPATKEEMDKIFRWHTYAAIPVKEDEKNRESLTEFERAWLKSVRQLLLDGYTTQDIWNLTNEVVKAQAKPVYEEAISQNKKEPVHMWIKDPFGKVREVKLRLVPIEKPEEPGAMAVYGPELVNKDNQ